jgi:hypothetical protein
MGLSADPSWYYPGIFGAYDPEVERDVFGILRRVTPRDMGGAVWNPGGVVARAIPVPTSSSSGAWVDVSGFGYMKTFAVTGNLVGTVNIDMSNEDTPGTAGAPVATFPAGRGNIAVASAAHWMRVRVGGYKSGAAIAQVGGEVEVGRVDERGDEIAARSAVVAILHRQRHVPHVEVDGIAVEQQHHGGQAQEHGQAQRVARCLAQLLERAVALIEPQFRLAILLVRSMARETVVGEDRSDVAVEVDFRRLLRSSGGRVKNNEQCHG